MRPGKPLPIGARAGTENDGLITENILKNEATELIDNKGSALGEIGNEATVWAGKEVSVECECRRGRAQSDCSYPFDLGP